MTYQRMKETERKTDEFFRKKYGFFWRWKVKPSIECDEYFNKFREISESLSGGKEQ